MKNQRDLIIEKLLEMCKYIKWKNVESFDNLESDYIIEKNNEMLNKLEKEKKGE